MITAPNSAAHKALSHHLQDIEGEREEGTHQAFWVRFYQTQAWAHLPPDAQTTWHDFWSYFELLRAHKQGEWYYPGTTALLQTWRVQSLNMPEPVGLSEPLTRLLWASSDTPSLEKELAHSLVLEPQNVKAWTQSWQDPISFFQALWDFLCHYLAHTQPQTCTEHAFEAASPHNIGNDGSHLENTSENNPQTSPGSISDTPPTEQEHKRPDAQNALGWGMEMGQASVLQEARLTKGHDAGFYVPPRLTRHGSHTPYHRYTRLFDEIISIQKLVPPEHLRTLRTRLDALSSVRFDQLRDPIKHLTRLLRRPAPIAWTYDQNEGYLHGPRLARLLARADHPVFKMRQPDPDQQVCVSLLIDNSGSMRGRPIQRAALSADFLSTILKAAHIPFEVLGFTTKEWKGGDSFKKWQTDGSPPQPGRLNDLRHIVYKNFQTPHRQGRLHLAGMLYESILKENIDGEALLWAAHRLLKRPETLKILMVISDGSPIDDMTLAHNSAQILENHLSDVIASLSHSPLILMAIGIGHDVRPIYPRAVTIKSADDLEYSVLQGIIDLLS